MKKEILWRYGWVVITSILLVAALWRPDEVMEGAAEGLVLWYSKVLPAQFPFVTLVRLLLRLQGGGVPPIASIWAGGWLAGFPTGSFFAADQYQQGRLQEEYLLPVVLLSNTSGPLFVLGTVGVGMLGSQFLGMILLLIHWVAAGLTALFFWPKSRGRANRILEKQQMPPVDIGMLLAESAGEAAGIMIKVAEFIVLFAVVTVLIPWPAGMVGGLAAGLLEITGGIRLLVAGAEHSAGLLAGISFLLGFSGLSIFFQTASVLREVPCRSGRLLAGFLCRGVIAAGVSWGLMQMRIIP